MKKAEQNITTFNSDVDEAGQYLYTTDRLSAKLATYRQSLEIVRLIKTYVGTGKRILDIGSGDGTYTFELFNITHPKLIIGFDPADKAVKLAQRNVPAASRNKIVFRTLSIYEIAKHFTPSQFDVAVTRGVLHHLDDAPAAIREISRIANQVIILEPNGYNPILKVIEKSSAYHRKHDEKSYWPPTLLHWFEQQGYKLVEQKFVCIVPYFCPPPLASFLNHVQSLFESIPIIHKYYTGTNIFFMRKEFPRKSTTLAF